MLKLHYENIGVLTAFLRAAEKTPGIWPKDAIPELNRLVRDPKTGLEAAVDTLAAAMLEFHNQATKLGEQIADVIDDLEDGMKNGCAYTVNPSLAGAVLNIRNLIQGTPAYGFSSGDPGSGSTCWPSCSGSSSSSGFGGYDNPPRKY